MSNSLYDAFSSVNKTHSEYLKMTTLRHNINALQRMLYAIGNTSGPITISYKNLSANVMFKENGRGEMVAFLTNLLAENESELKRMAASHDTTTHQITPKYKIRDADGNLVIAEE